MLISFSFSLIPGKSFWQYNYNQIIKKSKYRNVKHRNWWAKAIATPKRIENGIEIKTIPIEWKYIKYHYHVLFSLTTFFYKYIFERNRPNWMKIKLGNAKIWNNHSLYYTLRNDWRRRKKRWTHRNINLEYKLLMVDDWMANPSTAIFLFLFGLLFYDFPISIIQTHSLYACTHTHTYIIQSIISYRVWCYEDAVAKYITPYLLCSQSWYKQWALLKLLFWVVLLLVLVLLLLWCLFYSFFFFHLRFNLDAAIHFFRIFAMDLLSSPCFTFFSLYQPAWMCIYVHLFKVWFVDPNWNLQKTSFWKREKK